MTHKAALLASIKQPRGIATAILAIMMVIGNIISSI